MAGRALASTLKNLLAGLFQRGQGAGLVDPGIVRDERRLIGLNGKPEKEGEVMLRLREAVRQFGTGSSTQAEKRFASAPGMYIAAPARARSG